MLDNRRSGRTTRMLAAAFRRAFDGNHVFVVMHDGYVTDYMIAILRDLGVAGWDRRTGSGRIGAGSSVTLIPMHSNKVDTATLLLDGVAEENVFWDHEAVRRAHNRILSKYHEWD